MAFIAGIDEAGRGPVFGPMVMAIAACDDEDKLRAMGVKDSKLLSPEMRDRLAAELKAHYEHEIISLSPAEIDASVTGSGDSLNLLEARTAARLILALAKRVPISKVTLDSPTRTTQKYERDVRAELARIDPEGVTRKIALVAECKADFNHPVVGAASILAKTTRDAAIQALTAVHGRLGSGYPSDPDTQAFLQSHYKEPHEFFRRSWESYLRLVRDAKEPQRSLAEFEARKEEHAGVVKRFEALCAHGFRFEAPTNPYEVVRMKDASGVTVIRYTTGKLVVQGPDGPRSRTEALLSSLGLAEGAVEAKRPRGRPRKSAS